MGSLTPNLGLTVPTVGGDSGPAFANEVNADLSIIDAVLGGVNNLNVGGSANITANTAQSQNFVHNLTGVLTGNIVYFLPPTGRFYAIQNNTTGAFLLAVAVSGGLNSITIPQGLSVFIWSDGQTVRLSNPPGWTEVSNTAVGGASSVNLALPAPFRRFRVTAQGIGFSAAGPGLNMLASANGGSSFLSTGYNTIVAGGIGPSTSTVGTSLNAGAWSISPLTNTATLPLDTMIEIYPGGAVFGPAFQSRSVAVNSTGFLQVESRSGNQNTVGLINAIQILATLSGTFSGTLIVEGLP